MKKRTWLFMPEAVVGYLLNRRTGIGMHVNEQKQSSNKLQVHDVAGENKVYVLRVQLSAGETIRTSAKMRCNMSNSKRITP